MELQLVLSILLSCLYSFHFGIDMIPTRQVLDLDSHGVEIDCEHPAHILACYSLPGHKTDYSNTDIPF